MLRNCPRASTLLTREISYPQIIDRAFLVIAIAALIGLPAQSIHNYQTFHSYRDFIDFDVSILTVLRGGSIDAMVNFSRRFNPILVALLPLYALWSDPRILLVLQSLGIAAAVFPLYWFARRQIGYLLALMVTLVYLVHPSIHGVNSQAIFYEIKLAIPLLSFALYFLLRERHVPFLICLGVSCLLKQEISFIAVGFAAYIFFVQRKRALGLGLAAAGAGLALFIIQFLYPFLTQGRPYPSFGERYAYLGNTLEEVVISLIQRPHLALQEMTAPLKIVFIQSLLDPLAWLPLVGLEVFSISLPAWAYTLLSALRLQVDPLTYYQSPLLPFLFFGTVASIRRLLHLQIPQRLRKTLTEPHARALALCALLFVSSQLYLPSIWTRILNPFAFTLDEHTLLGYRLMQQIPPQTTVVAQSEFYIPLSIERKYSRVLLLTPGDDYRGVDYIFGDSTRFWYGFHKVTFEQWRASGYFDPVIEQDGYFLLRRKPSIDPTRQFDNGWALVGYAATHSSFTRPSGLQFGNQVTLLGYAPVPGDKIRGGELLRLVVEWRAEQDIHDRYAVLVHVVDERGIVWAQDDREPIIPTDRWRAGDIVRDQFTFFLPRPMPPGNYNIVMGLWDPHLGKRLEVRDAQQQSSGIEGCLGAMQVEKDTTSTEAGLFLIEQPLYVDMHEVRLLGSTAIPQKLTPGEELAVGLYWRARGGKPRGDYVVSVQLRDALGRIAFEETNRPAAGAYPTTLWQPGEVLLDWHILTLPANLAEGDYTFWVVLRDVTERAELGGVQIAQISIER
jgi:uncharacterized membrane protein